MASRLQLQDKLEELLGTKNVYYQPPANVIMEYDAIKYSKKIPNTRHADNSAYSQMDCYEIIVIAKKPDHPVIKELMKLPYCSWDTTYTTNNLNHDVLTLYF